jgi:CBS domain-containing protein
MKVLDFCSRKVVTEEPTASLRSASLAMRNAHVGALVVVESKGGVRRPIGILTDRDIVIALVAVPGARLESTLVGDAMTSQLAVARADEGVFEAVATMRDRAVRRLPVVDVDGGLVGIVTLDDLLVVISTELANLAEALRWGRKRELASRECLEIGR